MGSDKSLSLSGRFKTPHPSFSHPGRFMRLLGPVILILFSTVDRLRYQLSMHYAITSQLVRHDLPGLTAMGLYQEFEEPLRCSTIPAGL